MGRRRAQLLAIVLGVASTGVAQTLSPERGVDVPVAGTFLPVRDNGAPQLAYDGTGYWMAWADDSLGVFQVFAQRVSTAGVVLDAAPLRVSPSSNAELFPRLACAASDCLLVWQDHRFGDENVLGVRLSAAGQVLDVPPLTITDAPGNQYEPAVGTDGTDYLVVWSQQDDPTQPGSVAASRLTSAGQLGGPGVFEVAKPPYSGQPDVTFAAGNYFVSYSVSNNPSSLYVVRVRPTGAVLDPSPILVESSSPFLPMIRLASDGTRVWAAWASAGFDSVNYSRLDGAAAVLDSETPVWTGPSANASLASTGQGSLWVLWDDGSSYRGARLALDGGSLDPTPVVLSAPSGNQSPGIACSAASCLAVWCQGGNYGAGLGGRRLTASGTVLDPTDLTLSPPAAGTSAESFAAIACNAQLCFVAWQDSSEENPPRVRGARLQLDGGVSDPLGLTLRTVPEPLTSLTVAAAPTQFLVGWTRVRSAVAQGVRVGLDGGALDAAPLSLAGTSSNLSGAVAAFDGARFVLAWAQSPNLSTQNLAMVHIGLDGAVSPRVVPTNPGGWQAAPSLASAAGHTLLTWLDGRSSYRAVYGTFIDADGGLSAPSGFRLTGGLKNQLLDTDQPAAIASDGTQFLLVWPQAPLDGGRGLSGAFDLFAERVGFDGGLLGGGAFVASGRPGNQLQPALAFDGARFDLAWADSRSGASEVYAVQLWPDGGAVGADFAFSAAPESRGPAVGSDGRGSAVLVYLRYDPAVGTPRVMSRLLTAASERSDAGATDAGAVDAGAADAGAADAGANDAGANDAGLPAAPKALGLGCGCSESQAGLMLALLLLGARRRR